MTLSAALPLLVAVPLLGAGITAFANGKSRWPRWSLTVLLVAQLVAAIALVVELADGSVVAHHVGGWDGGIAIPFVADLLSALMLTVTTILTLACSLFAGATSPGRVKLFGPLTLVLTAGINGALLTGDIFNLFVFIEVMLLPTYGLLILAQRQRNTDRAHRGSKLYVAFNLFVSTLFLAGVAMVYGVVGTVNLAQLAGAAQENDLVAAGAGVSLVALCMKAAVFPTHGWLARAYPSTSPAVTALISGLHTKVAIYAIYRLYAVIFDGDTRFLWIGLVLFTATMVVGVLGAVGEGTTRSILAFHMVSQIGYILLGVAVFTLAGLAAGIFYLLHHMIVKASLFLSTGAIEEHYDTNELSVLKQGIRREPLVAIAFFMAALSLAGLPPFSGFVAKLTLIVATVEAGHLWVAVAALVVSLITLMSMLKIWDAVFAGRGQEDTDDDGHSGEDESVEARFRAARRLRIPLPVILPGLALACLTLILGLGGELLYGLSHTAAEGLLDTSGYVEAVLGP